MPEETPWFTVEWMRELTRHQSRFEIGYGDLAELMKQYQPVAASPGHIAGLAGAMPSDADVFVSQPGPRDVERAVNQFAELNDWAILSAVDGAFLPTGTEATRLVQEAFDPSTGTFTFDRSWS